MAFLSVGVCQAQNYPPDYPFGEPGTPDHPDGYDGYPGGHPDNPDGDNGGDGGDGIVEPVGERDRPADRFKR